MPPGAKKRKALKKKQKEQGSTGATSNNKGFNGHENDAHGSQDERESDGNLSSPGSQGNEEFGAREPSPPPLSGLRKVSVNEKTEDDAEVTRGHGVNGEGNITVGRGKDHEENGVDKSTTNIPVNHTNNTRKAASQETGGTSVLESAPAVDSVKPVGSSVSKVVISDKIEQVEIFADSEYFQQTSDEKEEKLRLKEAKEGYIPGSSTETNKEFKSVNESKVTECSEEKSLLPSGPLVVRTSWLSCCGLFGVMGGSER